MNDFNAELLSFEEDLFDLEAHRKAADEHAQHMLRARRQRRLVSVCKIIIVVVAFIAAYLLYNLASELILQYDYYRYHRT